MSEQEKVTALAWRIGRDVAGPGNTGWVKARPYAELLLEARDALKAALYDMDANFDPCECDRSADVYCSSCRSRAALSRLESL